ncbi:peptide chain release factor N(5)-glutamine methyltransferase [Calidifontibacter indicus]|uniref:peptide chain release factor N(5)-glutamine methyltransferase n=1 Tax=Calidifontibacter indicus TaxID=419650 RepID=A0A3D9UTG7_9MICO|nr:peptide chain release factor N(5)-glutamine methyltransferase [Calidifontibacter indicus]REF31823.1 release factor glutamine methyltransferase [Calidifontibacter indicus]
MNDLRATLRAASDRLRHSGIHSADAEAHQLLEHAWGRSGEQVRRAVLMGEELPDDVGDRFDVLVDERARRVPLQHLTGRAHFRHLELEVGPGVFVPRPETELIVDLGLAHVPQGGTLVDLCTGAAPIPLAVKQERPDLRVHAVELTEHAFAWATRNAQRLGLDIDLVSAPAQDAFPELTGVVDVVLSNPPYIPDAMVPVDPEVRDHDPAEALYGGSADGLRIPLEVAARAFELLRPGGVLIMEHAETQGDSLPAALARAGWVDARDEPDLTGRPRFAVAFRPR